MDSIGRAIVVVLDGVGVGALPDAASYGDEGSDTLGNIARQVRGLAVPNLQRWGLGNIVPVMGVDPSEAPAASYGKMREESPGKDSTAGHWELMGCCLDSPFPLYPDGFPPEVTRIVAEIAGAAALGNVVASGTDIIEELGVEHLRTGRPILYTSADSVLQLAAHSRVWPAEKLHGVCAAIRARLLPPHQVARVIARPFFGEPGGFVRTQERKDFTVPPVKPTALDLACEAGLPVIGVGKISDLFGGRGLTASRPAKGLDICLEEILAVLSSTDTGLIIANLGDFDTLWGHRNDVEGFAAGLVQFDQWIPEFERLLRPGRDLAVLTADHGCDPTTPSTDHSREYVPLLVWNGATGVALGERSTFADVSATITAFLGVTSNLSGVSFLGDLPAVPRPEPESIHDPAAQEDAVPAPASPADGSLPSAEPLVPSPPESHSTMPPAPGAEGPSALRDGIGPHAEDIARLVKEIQEDLPSTGNLFHAVLQQEGKIPADLLLQFINREQDQMVFIGTLLVQEGALTHDGLTDLLTLALARWLDQAGLLTAEIRRVFDSRPSGMFGGEHLLDEGLISEERLAAFYVRACSIPYIQLSGYRVPREASEVLPRESAVASGILPIAKEGTRITVATSRPADSRLAEELASWTGCEVRTVLAMRDQLLEALGTVYLRPPEAPTSVPPAVSAGPGASLGWPESPTAMSLGPVAIPAAHAAPESAELSWLLHAAKAMTKNAYAPHSLLCVGAAVMADNGEVFAGCNVENDSYGLSMCAERVAIFKAISSGRREIKAIAVVADGIRAIKPCGACLQVARQFGPNAVFVFESAGGGVETRTISELLPFAFVLEDKEA